MKTEKKKATKTPRKTDQLLCLLVCPDGSVLTEVFDNDAELQQFVESERTFNDSFDCYAMPVKLPVPKQIKPPKPKRLPGTLKKVPRE